MSIVSEIMRIEQAKANLKDNLNSVLNDNQIPDSATLDQYTEYISLLKKQKPYQDATTIAPTTTSQTITAKDGYNLSSVNIAAVVPSDYYKDETQLSITPSISQQNFSSTESIAYNQIVVEGVTSSIDANCKPENIKDGITILGITGTCSLPTLYPPTISLSQGILTIADEINGDFSSGYDLYINGVHQNDTKISSKTVDMSAYTYELTDSISVKALGLNFNTSEFSNFVSTPTYKVTYQLSGKKGSAGCTYLIHEGTTYYESGEFYIERGDVITLGTISGAGSFGITDRFFCNGTLVAADYMGIPENGLPDYDYIPIGDVVITTVYGDYSDSYLVDSGVQQ